MPIFFQQEIDSSTQLAIWRIEEDEAFFLQHVPLQRDITHPHKRLQHLAGRYLLQYLAPDFPISLIKIADTRKPYLENEAYHFSISHCSDYAAAIISKTARVGVDIEVPSPKVEKIKHKFLTDKEWQQLYMEWYRLNGDSATVIDLLTLSWSCKEAMFKWWGLGDVDFKSVLHLKALADTGALELSGTFQKKDLKISYPIQWQRFDGLVLAWVATMPDGQKVSVANATSDQ